MYCYQMKDYPTGWLGQWKRDGRQHKIDTSLRNSLAEELREHRGNNALKVCVSSALALNKREPWKLLSCSEEGDVCRADFVCRDEARGSVNRLSYGLNEMGRFGHITVEAIRSPAVME